jgi:hypothetical protein
MKMKKMYFDGERERVMSFASRHGYKKDNQAGENILYAVSCSLKIGGTRTGAGRERAAGG